jgi:hypothetical protein
MQIIKHLYKFIFLNAFIILKIGTADNPTESVEKSLSGKIAHIANLNINITCNPQQIIKDIKQDLFLLFYKFPEVPIRHYRNLCASRLYDYRYTLIGSMAVGLYLFLFYEVIKGNNYLESQDSWALWKQHIPLSQLLEIPQEDLSNELILEIQCRYTNRERPTDFISSLITFMRDIEKEIEAVKYFITLESRLRSFRIARLFPINSRRFSQASDKLNRLTYVKNTFLTWAAHYKMNQNRRYPIYF